MAEYKRVSTALALVALVLAIPALAGDGVDFSYGFEAGFEQAYKISFNQDIDAGFFVFNRFADLEVMEKCVGADSAGFKMEMVFEKVDASRRFGETLQADNLGRNLTGKKVSYVVSPDGEVGEITPAGYVEGWDRMSQVIRPVIESGYVFLPGREVAEGETWDRKQYEDKTESGLTTVTDAEFRFRGMKKEKDRACARVEGKSSSVVSGQLELPNGMADAKGKGSGKYEFYFDPATSIIVKLKNSVEATLEIVDDSGESNETTFSYNIKREIR